MDDRTIRGVTRGMRAVLWAGCGFVFLAGVQLYLLSAHTDVYFAWTIRPPLTAAILGAFYWTALVLSFLSARQSAWVDARVGIPGVLLFLLLTLLATLLHLDRFHLHAPEAKTALAAWTWLLIYIADPVALLIAFGIQLRTPGRNPPRLDPLPAWFRGALLAEGGISLGIGVTLFVAPLWVGAGWPWALTPLTARALGAWLTGLGVILGQAAWENDWGRIRATMISTVVFGLLVLLAFVRYPGSLPLGRVGSWLCLAYALGFLLTGCIGTLATHHGGGVPAAESG